MSQGHPPEFRAEAVRLAQEARESGKTVAQVAADLGISAETLRRWRRQAEVDAGRTQGLTTSEREVLIRLRRENRILREERDILKKAAAFFAQEANRSR